MEYLLGNEDTLKAMPELSAKVPFSQDIVDFCQTVSRELMKSPSGKGYPDVTTLGFWLRKSSIEAIKKRFAADDGFIRMGRGVIFHIAPSNVPVNFAYSLFTGLLCGNANIVRIPSKEFAQISVIVNAIRKALDIYPDMIPYICLVRYGHEREINDHLSSICDVRVIWGGDATIKEIRKSPLPSRATEVPFADRFSLAVIDAGFYGMLDEPARERIARGFYNDTYLTDQNACTSPRMVVWLRILVADGAGEGSVASAQEDFWSRLWKIVSKEYAFQDIQGVNKLTKTYLLAANAEENMVRVNAGEGADNRLVRVEIGKQSDGYFRRLPDYFDNSGYFLEYVTSDILDLTELCRDIRCQTISYVGDKDLLTPLLTQGVKGIDRIVPVGKTMDFDFLWDGYDLYERLTRSISL